MQEGTVSRTNRERTEATRAALIKAARSLFVEKGYAETGTPEIVAAAGVTRGALYHHFADKQALFRAVVEHESAAVAEEIVRKSSDGTAIEMLIAGGNAFFSAMAVPGRTRLLLLDGPAVLGRAEMDAIDARHAGRTLREGLAYAMEQGEIRPLPLDQLCALLGAAFDRAALAIRNEAETAEYQAVIGDLIKGLRP
ncbi:TetR/AcrR family transcriptional regulator [Pseudaminobacter sp. 19-2017]|uniref:TetR/AcrR family transcriptional regulator n=1 Tax=Pseudaminobacter soli (ex Zhang et al. 2022) TaxID=2831468 RepID=A0A942IA40_9HYPH|nr:TetR/AcrR family transcriptional regulator [Pseudaminobacter soli]MBS3650960.1 TetR/AcrR family transcriptional regulator [Pseudaminobacter soli]